MPPIQFVVDRRDAGQTLAAVLKSRFGVSWAQAKRIVERGHVKVSGQLETDVARRLKLGKRVELASGAVEVPQEEKERIAEQKKKGAEIRKKKAEEARKRAREEAQKRRGEGVKGGTGEETPAFTSRPQPAKEVRRESSVTPSPAHPFTPSLSPDVVVYADDDVVVVNKPAGLTTMRHADEAAEFGRGKRFLPKTLADMLPALLGAPNRPVIAVHRIDRDTSGLVVFARTRGAAESLMKQFRKHATERRYLALTRGVPPAGRIESVFVRDRGDGRRGSTVAPRAEDGKRAVTHVAVIETLGDFALSECRLETGRTHQVRIHLGEAGTPLCGETVYDRPPNGRPLPDGSGAGRPMLHATRLGFTHPESGEAMNWEVEPPEDFRAVLAKLRG